MRVSYRHESVRLTGRWDITNEKYAETTNTGAYIDFAFEGKMALVMFDITTNSTPLLHLWIQVDGGAMTETSIDSYIRIVAPDDGKHVCRIIFKGSVEAYNRWYQPLQSKVSFIGFEADKPLPIGKDERKSIEFVGDSITEGVLIDVDYCGDGEPASAIGQHCRIYQDDVCATYSWLTAEALDMIPICVGFGAVGVTKTGQGKVPKAPVSYPYNFDGSPMSRPEPDVVLINHGANDRRHTPEEYAENYTALLDLVRQHNPHAKIVSLSAFCGGHHDVLVDLIPEYNKKNNENIYFIDSTDWVPVEPLHPLRDGHKIIAEHLIEELKKII